MLSGWRDLQHASEAPHEEMLEALRQPAVAQAALLASILTQNADTDFGRRHGFSKIRSPSDFQRAVPITTYDDCRQPILDMADKGRNILVAEPVIAFETTGGTSSGSKLIPYTESALRSFRNAVLPWLYDLVQARPEIAEGRCYVSISPAGREQRFTPSGIPVGLPSEGAYLGGDLADSLESIIAVPPDVAMQKDLREWRLATLASLVACRDLSFVSVWSPTFFTSLLDGLTDDDLPGRLDPQDRKRLERALTSDRQPAAELWPELSVISCWADGSSLALARELADLCPHAKIQPKGLLATEGVVTIPFGPEAGCIPAITSTFLEFVDAAGAVHLVNELVPGETYRVLMTTPGGLYRYDLGDLVRCLSCEGHVPRLVFEGRTGVRSDLVGEKLDEAFVAASLSDLPFPAMLVARTEPEPHYALWLDGPADTDQAKALEMKVEDRLRRNPQYAYARDIGQLTGIRTAVKPGFIAARHAESAASGARLGDLKHTALLPAKAPNGVVSP